MMMKKNIVASMMLAFLAAGVFFGLGAAELTAPASSHAEDQITQSKTVVYYFHGNQRCRTCNKIEALTKKILEEGFAAQLKDGSMEVRVLNVDQAENEHFVTDYELAVRSVVLSKLEGGKETNWRRLDKVWQLVHDEAAFAAYLREEIGLLLKGKG
jgi:hypothetical protein